MMGPGKIQVPGFCRDDNCNDVVRKGAKGLSITHSPDKLQFLRSFKWSNNKWATAGWKAMDFRKFY